jgi:serine phosphatase RsbU (regulator of sigma subunit)
MNISSFFPIWFFCLILFLGSGEIFPPLSAQTNEADSLKRAIIQETDEKTKVDALNRLCWIMLTHSPEEALQAGEKALELAQKIKYPAGESDALNKIGIYYKQTGNYSKALDYYTRSADVSNKAGDTSGTNMCLNNMANVYKAMGEYPKALSILIQLEKSYAASYDTAGMADVILNMALLYEDLNYKEKCLELYERSLLFSHKINDDERTSRALLNLGNLLTEGNEQEKMKGIGYYMQCLQIDRRNHNRHGESKCLTNIGATYHDMGELNKAKGYYMQSLKIKQEINDRKGIAILYENLGHIYLAQKEMSQAKNCFDSCYIIAKELGDAFIMKIAYQNQASFHSQAGDFKTAYQFMDTLYNFNDSLFNAEMQSEITQMKTQFEAEKKDNEIKLLQKDNDLHQTELRRKRILVNSLIGIGALMLALAIFIYTGYRNKKRANTLLRKQQKEISQQKDQIEQQRDALSASHVIIEQRNRNITDSIRYALRIQQAMLPSPQFLQHILPASFVLYLPKDIVSGDFYRVIDIKDTVVFTAVDCTGHGVPGAFMSLVANELFNHAVIEKGITSPDEICNSLSRQIKEKFRSENEQDNVKDGMDLTICCWKKNTNQLEFAGVHNPVYLVRNNNILEFKGDKHPIGEPFNDDFPSYSKHSLDIIPGDTVYLFSDGIIDQFGGPNRKKFLSKRFRELLLEIQQYNMNEQPDLLHSAFTEWRGKVEQYDDVLVMGLRF